MSTVATEAELLRGAAPAGEPLSVLLREGTRAEHDHAEHSPFVTALVAGELPVLAYADLAAQHHAIYSALEAAGESLRLAGQDGALVRPELLRGAALERDLAHLVGPAWRETVRLHPATLRYATRLAQSSTDIARYAAHAYTRYLGDLSGGQIIKRMLERHHGLGPEGVEFYTFTAIAKIKPFKDAYRATLDALPLDEASRARAVAEAGAAFRLNSELFADLAEAHLA